jgi:hypothetical protein
MTSLACWRRRRGPKIGRDSRADAGRQQMALPGETMQRAIKTGMGGVLAGALLAMAPAAQADTPVSQKGTWKLNVAESDQGRNPNPVVDGTLTVTKDDGKALQFTLAEKMKDGSTTLSKFDGAYDGKMVPASDHMTMAYEHAPGGWRDTWEVTAGPGKGVKGSDDCTMSADGKKQTCTGGMAGKPPSYRFVYDKVAP